MHDKFNRCGGFIVHDSKEEALKVIENYVKEIQTEIQRRATGFRVYVAGKSSQSKRTFTNCQ